MRIRIYPEALNALRQLHPSTTFQQLDEQDPAKDGTVLVDVDNSIVSQLMALFLVSHGWTTNLSEMILKMEGFFGQHKSPGHKV